MPTLTPVPKIEDKKKKIEKNKVKRKVKRNLGPNFISLTDRGFSRQNCLEATADLEV